MKDLEHAASEAISDGARFVSTDKGWFYRFSAESRTEPSILSEEVIRVETDAVIDGRRVLTGSYNWTENARRGNVEVLMSLREPEAVERFAEIFETLWEDAGGK